MNTPITFPKLTDKQIEAKSLELIKAYKDATGKWVNTPMPVFEMIEYLGYDVDFRKDGIYEDLNLLGGLCIPEKVIEINENLSHQEGRMNFTAAHEIGHIILHVPVIEKAEESEKMILCRETISEPKSKKELIEIQADKFAAYLLMPTTRVKGTFFQLNKKPLDVKKPSLKDLVYRRSPKRKAYLLTENILRKGRFENVSKKAMMNRLIGLGLIRNLPYQKS